MRFSRRLLHGLTPPLFAAVIRRLFPHSPRHIWEGVYSHLDNVPISNGSYDFPDRVNEMTEQAATLLSTVRNHEIPPLWHDLLAVLAASIHNPGHALTIVDFGGAAGSGFIQLLSSLRSNPRLQYHVIDLPGMCNAASRIYKNGEPISFHTSIDTAPTRPDIVYINTVLQYISDYQEHLRLLENLQPKWLLLARTSAGEVPTFASRQLNLSNQVLPYWFFNRNELVSLVASFGYALEFENLADHEYSQEALPKSHRIGRMRNLLFRRINPDF